MNLIAIAAYGVFAILVGANGNAARLNEMMAEDVGGFIPWAVSIGVLSVLYEFPQTRSITGPFLLLMVLSYVLKNWTTLQSQFNELTKEANK